MQQNRFPGIPKKKQQKKLRRKCLPNPVALFALLRNHC